MEWKCYLFCFCLVALKNKLVSGNWFDIFESYFTLGIFISVECGKNLVVFDSF